MKKRLKLICAFPKLSVLFENLKTVRFLWEIFKKITKILKILNLFL